MLDRMPVKHQGNENLFLAVEMSLVSTLAGTPLHVHAEGLRGTGKTTVMRWAKQVVPDLRRIAGCPYQCDPERPRCPKHSGTTGIEAGVELVPMPFVEIGHGAKLGTVLGSIDLARLTAAGRPEAALLPGSIPMANRGIIFVDEVNRLAETAPEITDVLLSVMGTKPGYVKIEEVGLPPCEIEVSSSVWAASNPDEDPGPLEDIRKQLADRFDLVVPVQRPSDPAVIEGLLTGRTGGENAAKAPAGGPLTALQEKAARLPGVKVPQHVVRYMAQLYTQRNVESLRAVEALELSSRLYAAIHSRGEVSFDDILAVIPLVLRHRVEPAALAEILKDLELRKAAGAEARPPAPGSPGRDQMRAGNRPQAGQKDDGIDRQGDPPAQAGDAGGPGSSGIRPEARSPFGGVSGGQDGESQDSVGRDAARHNAERAGFSPMPAGRTKRATKDNWLDRLLRRYRRSGAAAQDARQGFPGAGGRRGVTRTSESSPGPASSLPDPAKLTPASPPDKARRISSMPWDEIVLPPDWKGGPP